jgi:hypothetical protein
MKNALLIVPCKTGFAVVELSQGTEMPKFLPADVKCFSHLDHYSRHETVLEAIKEHFAEKNDA